MVDDAPSAGIIGPNRAFAFVISSTLYSELCPGQATPSTWSARL